MARNSRNLSLWYPFFLITLLVIIGMFWFNYQKISEEKSYTTIQEELIKPLPGSLNAVVIDDLQKRIDIKDDDVVSLQISSRNSKSSSAIMEEQALVEPITVNKSATSSSELINSIRPDKISSQSAL